MTQYSAKYETQKAMYALLMPFNNIDAQLAGLGLNGVYDWKNVPQNAPFDYITLGDGYELTNHTFGGKGYKLYAMLHLFSNQNNSANVDLMLSRVNQLFDEVTLTLDTLGDVYSLNQRTTFLLDQSGTIPILHYAIQYLSYGVQ